jgi:mannose-6-phosphate isomerase-like protein (cupin superfamily)
VIILDQQHHARDEWRPGVVTRMRVSAVSGTTQLCIFEQWCDPGCGAPTHLHAVEEVLTVLDGQAEVWLGDERSAMIAGQSLIVPAGHKHGFRNTGQNTLHVQATLAAPIFEAAFDDAREVSRRWLPQPKA